MTGQGDAKEISHFQDEPMKGALTHTHTHFDDGGEMAVGDGGRESVSTAAVQNAFRKYFVIATHHHST